MQLNGLCKCTFIGNACALLFVLAFLEVELFECKCKHPFYESTIETQFCGMHKFTMQKT